MPQRAASPNQNALSLAMPASAATISPFISDRKLKICLTFVARQGDLLSVAHLNIKRIDG
jgi:hypothetical protein